VLCTCIGSSDDRHINALHITAIYVPLTGYEPHSV